jgi:hypothetical protein
MVQNTSFMNSIGTQEATERDGAEEREDRLRKREAGSTVECGSKMILNSISDSA